MGIDRRSLAKAITLVESTRSDHREKANQLLSAALPKSGNAFRIGISGTPGVGKSTFIEAFGLHLCSVGLSVAVLAVDPSSRRHGGSILGDKTRMATLSAHENAFIRPSPSSGTLGGVARRTREAMVLCEAAGYDVVLVETVGVGQSETAVANLTDVFLLLLAPAGGDELQGVKRGIMELADVVLVNKADGPLLPLATSTMSEYASALHLLRPKSQHWQPPCLLISALMGTGIQDLWWTLADFRSTMSSTGELARRREAQNESWLWDELEEQLMQAFRSHRDIAARLTESIAEVRAGRRLPGEVATELLRNWQPPN